VDALKSVKSATSLELPASSAAFTDAIESLSRLEKTVSAKATELAIVTDTPAPAEDESFHYQGSVSPPPVESTDSTYVTQSPSHYGAPLPPPSMISIRLSRTLDDLLRTPYPRPSQINKAYDILLSHSASPGQFPAPETLGRLINSLGRLHDIPKLQSVYSIAQTVLYSLSADPEKQRYSWFHIEDQVVEAYAHANDFNSSAFHRLRMISLGGVPSADAYGAVISNIKDTTDDATLALDIYHESQRVGTRPSTFLYNTIISKLSRARKAKQVLLLFQRMLDEGLSPSSVTYGAVICACCRVGDGDRARGLFEEMVAMKNFKPQATPYNTMMQYYVQIDPNRQKVLYFYTAMRKAGVRPTEHTYKVWKDAYLLIQILILFYTQLLIDCYGTIEPVSVSLMESTFASLVSDSSVRVQGCHWASLLNAHGCVLKDLSSALSIFASIPSPPDPIVWETMINVYVSNDRSADLLPQFVDKMKMEGVRMTAYIANALIKGYSSCDEIGRARDVFDEMEDPPRGFAGLFNRSAHEGEDRLPAPQGCPVYREVRQTRLDFKFHGS
jgi:pentatricopeptide repeat protein